MTSKPMNRRVQVQELGGGTAGLWHGWCHGFGPNSKGETSAIVEREDGRVELLPCEWKFRVTFIEPQ